MTGELLHHAGEIILCERGHRVAKVLRDIHLGDEDYATAIGEFEDGQIVPKKGDKLPLECHCGALWFGKNHSFMRTTQ